MKHEKLFRKDHPETIGEKDRDFDRANYIDWLESKYDEIVNKNESMKTNIVYTLHIQDGEHRHSHHSPQELEIDQSKDSKTQINEFGERLASTFYGGNSEFDGEWHEFPTVSVKYYSFEIIPDNDTYQIIKNILYKI